MLYTNTMSTLGTNGRFGNMLYQLMALMAVSDFSGMGYAIPDKCILREIFYLNNIEPSEKYSDNLPRARSDEVIYLPIAHDMFGYFQFQEVLNLYSKEKVKATLTWQSRFDPIIQKCREETKDKIVCHVRRGDYVTQYSNRYAILDKSCYLDHITLHCPQVKEQDIMWIGDEEPSRDTYGLPDHLSFLPDFFRLMTASVLYRSNSTFSWWANVFADNNQVVISPIVGDKTGWVKEVNWAVGNWPVMAHPKNFEGCRNTNLFLKEY